MMNLYYLLGILIGRGAEGKRMRNIKHRRTFMRANAWLCTAVALAFASPSLTSHAWSQGHSGGGMGMGSHGAGPSAGVHSSGMGSHSFGSPGFGGFGNGHSGVRSFGFSQNSFGAPRPSFELPGTSHPTIELPGNRLQTSPARGSRHQFGFRRNNIIPWGYDLGFYPGYVNTGVPYGDSYGYDDQADAQGQAPYQGQPPDQGQAYASPENGPAGPPPYDGSQYGQAPGRPPYGAPAYAPPAPQNTGPITDGLEHPEITLIFNNGHPPQKIQSYALTKNTLFALDGSHQRQIPLSELDVPATVEKNRENGVEFSVPGTPN
jgi:hypothetical protein